MTFTRSISFDDDLYDYLDQFRRAGGNLSALISKILMEYFQGGRSVSDNSADFAIRHSLIERDLEKVKGDLADVEKALSMARSDFTAASEKQIIKRDQRDDQILQRLEKEFSDIPVLDGEHQYRAWARSLKLDGSDPISIIKNRIANTASITGASRSDVMGIVKREYPGMIDLLDTDPGVL